MEELKDLRVKGKLESHEGWFLSIAKLLLNRYIIKTSVAEYRLTEIEFYYYSSEHPDITTYGYSKDLQNLKPDRIKRLKLAQRETFTWFFHYSGIDIVIGNVDSPGGVLIRSIINIKNNEIIKGPLVVQLELLNQQLSINESEGIQLKLVKTEDLIQLDVQQKTRIGISGGGFESKKYNFFT